jgi:hypothetical protein
MINIQAKLGLRTVALAAVGIIAIAAPASAAVQSSASSAPIVISYEKTCDETVGHCVGTAGDGGTIEMQVTGFRLTRTGAQLTLTEWITVGDLSFTAEMVGRASPGESIVLTGTVTEGSYAGAQVHQRSEFIGIDGTTTSWIGRLQLIPAS